MVAISPFQSKMDSAQERRPNMDVEELFSRITTHNAGGAAVLGEGEVLFFVLSEAHSFSKELVHMSAITGFASRRVLQTVLGGPRFPGGERPW